MGRADDGKCNRRGGLPGCRVPAPLYRDRRRSTGGINGRLPARSPEFCMYLPSVGEVELRPRPARGEGTGAEEPELGGMSPIGTFGRRRSLVTPGCWADVMGRMSHDGSPDIERLAVPLGCQRSIANPSDNLLKRESPDGGISVAGKVLDDHLRLRNPTET